MAVPKPGVLPGPREHEVLVLVAEGLTNEQIAKRMDITRSTVVGYVANLSIRLEAHGRANLVHQAHQLGLLGPICCIQRADWAALAEANHQPTQERSS